MITLNNLLPYPIQELGNISGSEIWDHSISFEKGKKYLVVAPSGKGKSTLIHCIYGIRKDYNGEVILKSKNIKDYSDDDLAEFRQNTISIVFQDLRLFEQLTAFENILLKNNLTNQKTREEILEMANTLGIAHLMDKPTGQLSFGQRQRVAIIRSLVQPFDFLLLDEPFSHLDEKNIEAATKLINTECQKNNAGFILVSLGESYFFNYDFKVIL